MSLSETEKVQKRVNWHSSFLLDSRKSSCMTSTPTGPNNSTHQTATSSSAGSSAASTVFAVLGAAFLLSMPFLRGSEQKSHENSVVQAQSVAYQAFELEQRKLDNSSRQPSSLSESETEPILGTLGVNTSGAAYHYKIRKEGDYKVVDVWTEGPGGVKTQVVIPPQVKVTR